ncbi:putative 65-kDa microtubule-associated protein 6-like isoform X1, partial [Capsicum annuum]
MPFIPIRERLREKAEEYFRCQYELFVEFTGLISWCRGASIGWHSDDNRPYLKQRDFAAVCYLNSYDADFKGGIFHFKDGEPADVVPMAGDVIMYTADDRNIHSVDEITEGERITLTLWFSRDASHDEDRKLISSLSPALLDVAGSKLHSYIPVPGSINMYWFPPDEASSFLSGFDIRCGRLHVLGFDIYPFQETSHRSASDSSHNLLELLSRPLLLVRDSKLF